MGVRCRIKDEVHRLSPRLLATAGVVAAGLVAVLLLQDHFVGDFTASLNVVPRSYRAWRDPVALLCAFAAIVLALRIALGRLHRLELALAIVGCTLAAAVYVHPAGRSPVRLPAEPTLLSNHVAARSVARLTLAARPSPWFRPRRCLDASAPQARHATVASAARLAITLAQGSFRNTGPGDRPLSWVADASRCRPRSGHRRDSRRSRSDLRLCGTHVGLIHTRVARRGGRSTSAAALRSRCTSPLRGAASSGASV